jgi:hypothetical protein
MAPSLQRRSPLQRNDDPVGLLRGTAESDTHGCRQLHELGMPNLKATVPDFRAHRSRGGCDYASFEKLACIGSLFRKQQLSDG